MRWNIKFEDESHSGELIILSQLHPLYVSFLGHEGRTLDPSSLLYTSEVSSCKVVVA